MRIENKTARFNNPWLMVDFDGGDSLTLALYVTSLVMYLKVSYHHLIHQFYPFWSRPFGLKIGLIKQVIIVLLGVRYSYICFTNYKRHQAAIVMVSRSYAMFNLLKLKRRTIGFKLNYSSIFCFTFREHLK